ncbi:DUF4232 domain-containing protein [Actinocrinis sp.]|uniref:DUF4232 domain-containing protein n=1 Tax=Actinocrinis sp. TaxID=1920516 RepID=UPI002CB1FD3C|nr:DUF4232 domain-containing protein [Actinocrinis sp.]HXR73512.1 DUF4232 domain-containing protein [Actinocrinis sp.]
MTNGTPTPDDSRSDPRYPHPGGADPERADRLSREDRFEDSLAQTWDSEDAATDRQLRSLIGPVTPLYAPPYGFERVMLRARRRHNRAMMMGLAAGFTAVAVAAGGVVVGTQTNRNATVQSLACNSAVRTAPGAVNLGQGSIVTWDGSRSGFGGAGAAVAPAAAVRARGVAYGIGAASSGVDSGREFMDRKYEWAIGGVLTAAALSVGIIAGCSSGNGDNGPSANATESAGPAASQAATSAGQVQLPTPTVVSSTPAPSASGVPLCVSTDLSPTVSIVTGSAGAGHELMNVALMNNSGHTCTVFGFPGLQLEDRNNSFQATNVVRNFAIKPTTIVVKNNASVATTVQFDFDIPAADEPQTGPCEAQSVYLGIIPPEEKRQLSATIQGGPVTVCQHGKLNVLPFVSGTKGANQ